MQTLSNTEILCFVIGWQGGTIHQLARALDVTNRLILEATYDDMQWLCRQAQAVHGTEKARLA